MQVRELLFTCIGSYDLDESNSDSMEYIPMNQILDFVT